MAQKRISKDIIVHGATEMIEEMGYGNFSLHELAYRLGVKPSSLYNHMKNLEDLRKLLVSAQSNNSKMSFIRQGKEKKGKKLLFL